MMATAGTVWVDTRADTTGIARDLSAFASGAGRSSLLPIAAAAGAAALAVGGIGVAAVRSSTEFNAAISGVGAVANSTAAELEALSDAALQAGADTAFSASEAAIAEQELAKAGISVSDILGGALAGSLDLAAAGQLQLGEAATITAQALNTFNLEGDQTSRVADVLAAGANKSAADVGQLGQALAQGGLVAKQTGLSLEDTVGVLSLFADNALIGSDAGTSLKTALQRLVPQSAEAKDAMDSLGLSFFDASGNFVGIEETAQRLQDALGGLSTEQRLQALTTIFGADAIRSSSLLMSAGADGVRDYTEAVKDQGAAQRVAAERLDNLSGDLEKLRGSFETVLIGLGNSADTGLRSIVQGAEDVVNGIGEALDSPAFEAFSETLGDALSSVAESMVSVGSEAGDLVAILQDANVGEFFGALVDAATTAADVLGFVGGVAIDGIGAAAPAVGVLADALGAVAEQGDLVRIAVTGLVASKLVSFLTPVASAAQSAAAGFGLLKTEIANLAATRGVTQMEALRGVIGASGSAGLRGAMSGLTGAIAGPAGITAALTVGALVYQSYADAKGRAKGVTDEFAQSLRDEAGELNAATAGVIRTNLRDLGVSDEFDKIGLSVKKVFSEITANPGDLDKFRKKFQGVGEEFANVEFAAERAGVKVPRSVQQIKDAVDKGLITSDQGREIINALTDIDKGAEVAAKGVSDEFSAIRSELGRTSGVSKSTVDAIVAEWKRLPETGRQDFLDELIEKYPEVAEAAGIAAEGTKELDDASDSSAGSLADQGAAAAAAAAGLDIYADSAKDALGGVVGLLDAQDGLEDANQQVADASEKLADILSGNTEAVKSAREALADANKSLADARADTGPGSDAARDAERDLREARKALRDAQIEAGKEPEAGDFYEDGRDAILDALDRVAEAQQKLQEINSGTSDQVVSAQERVTEAQQNLAEELGKTGPKSREARDAQEELDDAQRGVITSAQGVSDALADMSAEDIPAAIAAVQLLGDQHLLSKQQVDEFVNSLLLEQAVLAALNGGSTEPPTQPTRPANPTRPGRINADREGGGQSRPTPQATRPGFRNADDGQSAAQVVGSLNGISAATAGSATPVAGLSAISDEVRALRGDLVTTVRFIAKQAGTDTGEALAPILREIAGNTRGGSSTSTDTGMAGMRARQAEYAR